MTINVMIVDDSIFIRAMLKQIIDNDPQKRFKVVASAKDGEDALVKLKSFYHEIDVITLDIEMPKKNGLETLKEIMRDMPKPVLMLSSLTKRGAKETIEALESGAVDFLLKPEQQFDFAKLKEELCEKLEQAANAKGKIKPSKTKFDEFEKYKGEKRVSNELTNIIVVGCSTGGPRALQSFVSQLTHEMKMCVVIVQHMPEGGYTASLASHLNQLSSFEIKEAQEGDELKNGKAFIAPGGYHVEIFKRGERYQLVLNKREQVSGHRPSVDVLFTSASRLKTSVPIFGVVMTGMGSDGTIGAGLLKDEKATIIVESEKTAIIYGMPKQVVKKGYADYVEDLENIVPKISKLLKK